MSQFSEDIDRFRRRRELEEKRLQQDDRGDNSTSPTEDQDWWVIGRLTVEITWVLMMAPLLTVFVDEARPILVSLLQHALLVLVEFVLDIKVVLHQQPSIYDLPRLDLDRGPCPWVAPYAQ